MLMCVAQLGFAQSMFDVTGVVKDTSGEPMVGVTVMEKVQTVVL